MIVGYALIMGGLAGGLLIARRQAAAARAVGAEGPPGQPRLVARVRYRLRVADRLKPGWPRLIAHYLATAVGGYLLLMIILILYYNEVAPVAGNFIYSAFTGCGLLIGLSLPVFLVLSWLAERKGWRL